MIDGILLMAITSQLSEKHNFSVSQVLNLARVFPVRQQNTEVLTNADGTGTKQRCGNSQDISSFREFPQTIRLPLERKNTLRIRKWESRFLLRLFISSNEVCNTAYALSRLGFIETLHKQ